MYPPCRGVVLPSPCPAAITFPFTSHYLRHYLHECSVLSHYPHITSHCKNPRERCGEGLTCSPSADLATFSPHMHQ